jgi:hypothetical protein
MHALFRRCKVAFWEDLLLAEVHKAVAKGSVLAKVRIAGPMAEEPVSGRPEDTADIRRL